MKKIYLLVIVIAGLFTIASCNKGNGPDHFAYKGNDYSIDSVALIEIVSNHGTVNEKAIYQFAFINIKHEDTTTFMMALYDASTTALDGNYPALIENTDQTRGIIPFALIAASGVFFQDNSYALTGEGGSVDITNNGGTYSIKFNKISAGIYQDLFDTNTDGDVKYTEVSTITGSYNGVIDKTIYYLSKGEDNINPLLKNIK